MRSSSSSAAACGAGRAVRVGLRGAVSIEELTGAELREVLSHESRGILVDFWSPWCAPCRALRPHLVKLAEGHETDWRFVAVNTESNPEAAEAHVVRSLPTILLIRNETELHRFDGGILPSAIQERLELLAGEDVSIRESPPPD